MEVKGGAELKGAVRVKGAGWEVRGCVDDLGEQQFEAETQRALALSLKEGGGVDVRASAQAELKACAVCGRQCRTRCALCCAAWFCGEECKQKSTVHSAMCAQLMHTHRDLQKSICERDAAKRTVADALRKATVANDLALRTEEQAAASAAELAAWESKRAGDEAVLLTWRTLKQTADTDARLAEAELRLLLAVYAAEGMDEQSAALDRYCSATGLPLRQGAGLITHVARIARARLGMTCARDSKESAGSGAQAERLVRAQHASALPLSHSDISELLATETERRVRADHALATCRTRIIDLEAQLAAIAANAEPKPSSASPAFSIR